MRTILCADFANVEFAAGVAELAQIRPGAEMCTVNRAPRFLAFPGGEMRSRQFRSDDHRALGSHLYSLDNSVEFSRRAEAHLIRRASKRYSGGQE